jgi:hypothetical protein
VKNRAITDLNVFSLPSGKENPYLKIDKMTHELMRQKIP